MDELQTAYDLLVVESKKRDDNYSVRKQLEKSNFQPLAPYEPGDSYWEVPNFVLSQLGVWNRSVGAEVHDVLAHGIAWSLSTLENPDWDTNSITRHFKPSVKHFERMLAHRLIDLDAAKKKMAINAKFGSKTGLAPSHENG